MPLDESQLKSEYSEKSVELRRQNAELKTVLPFDEVATRHNMVIEKDGADAMSGSDLDKNEITAYIIAVEDNVSASSVAHEALHVVNYMMRDRDMVPDLNNDEWQCYLLGWVVRQCHKYLKVG